MSDRGDLVRRLFDAFSAGGIDAALEMAPPDTVWAPLAADGREFVGDEVRQLFAERRDGATRQSQSFAEIEEIGDAVLVSGSLQLRAGGTQVDMQPTWVFFFEGPRLRRAVGYPTRRAALAALPGGAGV